MSNGNLPPNRYLRKGEHLSLTDAYAYVSIAVRVAMSEVEHVVRLNRSLRDKIGEALRTEALHIKLAQPQPTPEFVLVSEHAPNVERMMRGVMIACGVTRDEIERLLRERRERMNHSQRLAS